MAVRQPTNPRNANLTENSYAVNLPGARRDSPPVCNLNVSTSNALGSTVDLSFEFPTNPDPATTILQVAGSIVSREVAFNPVSLAERVVLTKVHDQESELVPEGSKSMGMRLLLPCYCQTPSSSSSTGAHASALAGKTPGNLRPSGGVPMGGGNGDDFVGSFVSPFGCVRVTVEVEMVVAKEAGGVKDCLRLAIPVECGPLEG